MGWFGGGAAEVVGGAEDVEGVAEVYAVVGSGFGGEGAVKEREKKNYYFFVHRF